ncbi:hypothetical protein CA601_43990 [Paraburkholderia hospita]|jgi:hypothetical protein|nr:hypothetical protein CA601_43990 [Paraburkholderia hospita]
MTTHEVAVGHKQPSDVAAAEPLERLPSLEQRTFVLASPGRLVHDCKVAISTSHRCRRRLLAVVILVDRFIMATAATPVRLNECWEGVTIVGST